MSSFRDLIIFFVISIKIFVTNANEFEIPRHHRDEQILNQILSADIYNSNLRPNAHTVVNVSISLLTLSTPNESSLTYEVELLMHLIWNDFRLKHEERGDHKYLNAYKHSHKLWIPDLYFVKHGKTSHKNNNQIIALRIFNNGDIHFTNRYEMQIFCSGNSRIFPFDSPRCNFEIESKFTTHEVELKWIKNKSIFISDSMSATNAYLIHTLAKKCFGSESWREDYSCLGAFLIFIRDKSYYLSVYFIPTIVLVSITFIGFWLTTDSVITGRIQTNLSALLGLIILFVNFRSNLPIVSNLTAINLWEFISILFVSLANIEFIVQYKRNRKLNTNTEYRQRFSSKGTVEEVDIRAPLCANQQSMEMTPIGDQTQRQQQTSAHNLRIDDNSDEFGSHSSLDNISKWIFPILYYLFVIIFISIYALLESQTDI